MGMKKSTVCIKSTSACIMSRDMQIQNLISRGFTYNQIADALHINVDAVYACQRFILQQNNKTTVHGNFHLVRKENNFFTYHQK